MIDVQRAQAAAAGKRGEIRVPERLSVVGDQLPQCRRCKTREIRLRLSGEVDFGLLQPGTFRKRGIVRHGTAADAELVHIRSGKPGERVDRAAAQRDRAVIQQAAQVGQGFRGDLDQGDLQIPEFRHQGQKTQVVIAGQAVLPPVFLAVPVFPVFFPGGIDPVGTLAVFAHFVGGIAEIITGNDHLGDLGKILLRQAEGNRNLDLLFFRRGLGCWGRLRLRCAAAPDP